MNQKPRTLHPRRFESLFPSPLFCYLCVLMFMALSGFWCHLVLFGVVWHRLVLKKLFFLVFRTRPGHLSLPKPVPVTFFWSSDMCFSQCLRATCHPVTTFTPWVPPSGLRALRVLRVNSGSPEVPLILPYHPNPQEQISDAVGGHGVAEALFLIDQPLI
jgi:hypothetical protein